MLDVVFTKTIEPPQDEDISVLTSCNSNSKEILNGNVQDCFNSSKEREPVIIEIQFMLPLLKIIFLIIINRSII